MSCGAVNANFSCILDIRGMERENKQEKEVTHESNKKANSERKYLNMILAVIEKCKYSKYCQIKQEIKPSCKLLIRNIVNFLLMWHFI